MSEEQLLQCKAADGTPLSVRVAGSGPTVLTLHGWTLDHRSFDAQLPLARDYRLARFDRRGFGDSAAAPDLGAEIGDIDAVIDALEAETVHLLGVSQGARLALRYAVARPGRLRSLIVQGVVLDGYTPEVDDDAPIPLAHYAGLVSNGDVDSMRREWLAHPMMSRDPLTPAQKRELEAMVARYSGRDLLPAPGRADQVPATLDALRGVAVPTLIITGEFEGAARKAHANQLCRTLPDAREVVLEGCGHLSNISRPHAYNELLTRFLAGLRS
jgi:pimeloyl-ACP methyl ester carboxylesterase